MKEHLNLANATTSASLAAGFAALMLAAGGHFAAGAALVALAAVLDGIDGLVARRFGLSGKFGSNLDSLADVVAFGVVPAYMLAQGPLAGLPLLGGLACLVFALAGAWRLARFPLVENRDHWIGLPIPTAGVLGAFAAAFASGVPAGLTILFTLVLAALMVSTVPFPTFTTVGPLVRRVRQRAASRDSAPAGSELAQGGELAEWEPASRKPPNRRARVRSRMAGRRRVRLRRRRAPAQVDP